MQMKKLIRLEVQDEEKDEAHVSQTAPELRDVFGESDDEEPAEYDAVQNHLEDDANRSPMEDEGYEKDLRPEDMLADEEGRYDSEEDNVIKAKEKPVGPPLELGIPLRPPPSHPDKMNVIKVSNIMGIDPKPFDPNTFVEEDAFVADESGHNKRIRLENNIVRNRAVRNADGTTSTYKSQTTFFNSENFRFEGDTKLWQLNNSTNDMDVIEFVTSPNNPDGELKKSVLGGKTIYDHAYFWPHFTPIPGPSDHNLMIFTLSKLTGHAGSRFGWALIKDKDVYEKMLNYISIADLGISKDTQSRVLKLIKVGLEGNGKPLFEFAYKKMRDRWERLTSVFSKSTRFSLQQRHPFHCNFFNETRLPSPAYAWVKCEREEENDCGAVLQAGNIIGRSGSIFSAKDRYVRLSLIKSQSDFELLLQRLKELVSLENGSIEAM